MATRFLERVAGGAAHLAVLDRDVADNVAPTIVDADDERLKYYDQTNSRVLTVQASIRRVITPTAAVSLTAAQSGSEIMLNAAAGFEITLPALAAGLNFRFTVAAAFATTPFTVVVPAANDNTIFGGATVAGADVPASAEGSINFVESAELPGDFVDVWSDGVSWFVNGRGTTSGSITFTT